MRNSFVIALLLASTSAIRLQKRDIEGHSDPAFQPHAILPNTLHKDQLTKIPAVARNEHIGDSVWRSAVDGGEPIPEPRRDLTGHMNSMFNYPVEQTPDAKAAKNNGIPAPETPAVNTDKAAVATSLAKAAKEASAEKSAEIAKEAPIKPREGEAAAAKTAKSLVQKKGVEDPQDIEGHSDPAFQPHPILPNTLHKDSLTKIPAVARNEHIGDSVWRSAVDGGEPNPEQRRDMTGAGNSMFNYPTKQTPDPTADPNNHGVAITEIPSVTVDKAAVDASKAKEAKTAEADKKEEDAAAAVAAKTAPAADAKTAPAADAKTAPAAAKTAAVPAESDPAAAKTSLAQKKDIEGHSDPDFLPHPILPNSVHAHAVKQMSPVARNEHIGDSVWRSSIDGGEPIPEPRRDLVNAHSFKYDGHTSAPGGKK